MKCNNCGYDEELDNLSEAGFCDTCQSAFDKGMIEALNGVLILEQTAWVAEDGSYGICPIILFEPDALTDDQWSELEDTKDSRKYEVVAEMLDN